MVRQPRRHGVVPIRYTLTDDFDADFGVGEWHGTNAFIREDDRIFRTYFVNDPEGYPQTPPYQWWNLHDEYGDAA